MYSLLWILRPMAKTTALGKLDIEAHADLQPEPRNKIETANLSENPS